MWPFLARTTVLHCMDIAKLYEFISSALGDANSRPCSPTSWRADGLACVLSPNMKDRMSRLARPHGAYLVGK